MSSGKANKGPGPLEHLAESPMAQPDYVPPESNFTSSKLFESFGDVPAVWDDICHPEDLAMDLKVLEVFQRTLADQCRCWGLIVYDAGGIAIGCAGLCLFQTEIIESTNPFILRWRERLRRIFPRLGRMPVLFCGLPVPAGATHLRVREGASTEAVLTEVDRALQRLARGLGARLTVFKELDDASPLAAGLSRKGYVRGAIPPMHLLDVSFETFAHYRDALKSRYRSQVHRSQKKLGLAGFEVLHGRGHAFVAEQFDEHAYQLYVAVQTRAEQKLELMPASFFREMATALKDEVLLTVIRREGLICAFTFAITRGRTHYNMYSGLDYALNTDGDLYFNLFYHDMDQAFRAGATSLHLGQTSDTFKSRLGTRAEKLWFFTRARPASLNTLLHLFAPLVFPKVAEVEPNDVFAEMR
jgi:Peptidogalycan biosysnthesis/recognition